MNPQRSATLAIACYPAVMVAGWALVSLGSTASPRAVDRVAPSLTASIDATGRPQANAQRAVAPSLVVPDSPQAAATAEVATKPILETKPAAEAEPVAQPKPFVVASAGDPSQILSPETPSAPTATTDLPTNEATPRQTRAAPSRIEIIGECLVLEPCIDQYLFALYQRTPKEDSLKVTEKRKVEIKRRGKMVTVTRSFTKLVDNDFTWKDPNAAERVRMSMSDYVIGGMDKNFKMKLFHLLQAAENAGMYPGITSGFRDDYRQGIASGLKAAANRSYHGGSLRGGYGHGLAADIVSVNGATRDQRWNSSEALWKWVDANGIKYGIGRPYLRFDPPHVGPVDGPEYVSRRGGTKLAAAEVKKRQKQAAHARHGAAPKSPTGKPSRRLAAAR